MFRTALYEGLTAKTGSPLIAKKTVWVPGGWKDLSALLEQMDDDD